MKAYRDEPMRRAPSWPWVSGHPLVMAAEGTSGAPGTELKRWRRTQAPSLLSSGTLARELHGLP